MKLISLFFSIFLIFSTAAQEICNNAMDDDMDGLIDLNDADCDCEGIAGTLDGIIPNPSFEEMDCCPDFYSDMECATSWLQPSDGTSDYHNLCGWSLFPAYDVMHADTIDLPDGEGWVGYWTSAEWFTNEYVATCLEEPMSAGTSYTLQFYSARGVGVDNHTFSLFGSPNCEDLSWAGTACPEGVGEWELIADQEIVYVDSTWQEITITFTPDIDVAAIALGGPCGGEPGYSYFYIDHLQLITADAAGTITQTGSWCTEDIELLAAFDSPEGSWQWYKDGIALIGETGSTIDITAIGTGEYSVVYTLDEGCSRIDHTVGEDDIITAEFTASNVCEGESIVFENISDLAGGDSPIWEWQFGDGTTSAEESPSHVYTSPGEYLVKLIADTETACPDTFDLSLTIYPIPSAYFEFIADGISSEDGAAGGCLSNPIQFNDLSTLETPSVIDTWEWDFGDGETSDLENPEHSYTTIGTYLVTLTVTSNNGCSATFEKEITLYEGLALDILANEPTCHGFNDGSLVINTATNSDELIFSITDSAGNTKNIDNSNAANNLTTGWYYYSVSGTGSCNAEDSIFISEPEEILVDLTTKDLTCHGDFSGSVWVDSVYKATGSYEGISYFWSPDPHNQSGLGKDSIGNLPAGIYVLTVNDENGCTYVSDFEIKQPDSLQFIEFGSEPAYCRLYSYQKGNGVVFASAIGGTPDYNYLWTNLETGETQDNTTWGGLNPGKYSITATDQNGCKLTKEIELDSINPVADFTIISDEFTADYQGTAPVSIELINQSTGYANPNTPDIDTTFYWNLDWDKTDWIISHDINDSPTKTYEAKGYSYEVIVCLVATNKNACTDTACKRIQIFEPIAFESINIFTPDGDGVNDLFTFEYKSASIAHFECIIINRWGGIVAELSEIAEGWDGNDLQGDQCTDGVYHYSYKAVTDNGTTISGQGTVELIRNSN